MFPQCSSTMPSLLHGRNNGLSFTSHTSALPSGIVSRMELNVCCLELHILEVGLWVIRCFVFHNEPYLLRNTSRLIAFYQEWANVFSSSVNNPRLIMSFCMSRLNITYELFWIRGRDALIPLYKVSLSSQ